MTASMTLTEATALAATPAALAPARARRRHAGPSVDEWADDLIDMAHAGSVRFRRGFSAPVVVTAAVIVDTDDVDLDELLGTGPGDEPWDGPRFPWWEAGA